MSLLIVDGLNHIQSLAVNPIIFFDYVRMDAFTVVAIHAKLHVP